MKTQSQAAFSPKKKITSLSIDKAPIGHVFGGDKSSKHILDYSNVEAEGKILIKQFKDVNPSTMTLITCFENEAPPNKMLFYTLPTGDQVGEITSLRWEGRVRGDRGGQFKNSIIVDIRTEQNILSTKISKKTIHMCGVKRMEMGETASKKLVAHINEAGRFLDYIKNNPEEYDKAASWILENSVSQEVSGIFCREIVGSKPGKNIALLKKRMLPLLNLDLSPPKELAKMVNLITYRLGGIKYHKSLEPILNYFRSYAGNLSGLSDVLKIKKIGKSMVNNNYNVGFPINAPLAATTLKDMGFMVEFSNTSTAYIKIKMVSTIPDGEEVCRRVKGHSEQTILFNPSGCVMHSGQGGKPMENCYNIFALAIAEIRDMIENKTRV